MSDQSMPSRPSKGLLAVNKVKVADHFDIDENNFTCKICHWDFNDRSKALQHFEKEHALHGKRAETQMAWLSLFNAAGECSLCPYKYRPVKNSKANAGQVVKNLRTHLNTRHPGKRKETVAAAFEHAMQEARDVALMYTAETSNRQTPTVPKNGYACEECGQLFASPKECLKHRNAAHPRHSNSFQCSQCGEVLSSFQALKDHSKRHKYRCYCCEQYFGKKDDVISHMEQCRQDRRSSPLQEEFQCPLCQKSFNAERLLKAHLAMKHNPAQQCPSSIQQIKIVKRECDGGQKRLKLTSQMEMQLASSGITDQSHKMARSSGFMEPKQEESATVNDLHDAISFAIVKEEVDDFVES